MGTWMLWAHGTASGFWVFTWRTRLTGLEDDTAFFRNPVMLVDGAPPQLSELLLRLLRLGPASPAEAGRRVHAALRFT